MKGDLPQRAAAAAASFVWERATPEAQGIESGGLIRALRRIGEDGIRLHSLIAIRNGRAVLELYLPPYGKNRLHNVKSVTKSVMSALVGIALEEGILESLDQSALAFFPACTAGDGDPRKNAITLRHLLTMTAGLELDENGPIMHDIFASDDWIEATFARPLAAEPGRRFLYSTPLTHVLSGLLTRAGGESLLALCNRRLFGPLGIAGAQWTRDPKGTCYGGSELFLTPRDMARFGLLYLNQGRWGGRQVVPADWVRESTSDHTAGIEAGEGYGYGWWRTPLDGTGYKAAGWGGQRIFVLPRWNMVMVATAADPEAFDTLFHDLETVSIGDGPLPPDPEAQQALEALVRDLEQPPPEPLPELPPLAKEISGRTYRLEDREGPAPFTDIAFDFTDPERAAMTIGTEEGPRRLALGLDGLYRTTPTGSFGRMPGNNRIALRGRWTDDQSLTLDYLDLGDPNHARLTVGFSEDRMALSADIEPSGLRFSLSGRS